MSAWEKKVSEWLVSMLARAKPSDKIVLYSSAPGSKGVEVESFEIETRLEAEEIPALADTILARAQDDATGSGPGVQRYTLKAYRKGEDAKKPRGRFMFRLRGEADLDLDEESGEDAPTMKGLMTQLMRHNEATNRTMAHIVSSFGAMMTRRAESSDKQVSELLHERTEMFKTIENSRSEEHAREIESHMTIAKEARIDKGFDKLMGLAPLIVNHVTGGKLLPEGKSDPLMATLEPLIESLTEDQFKAIAATLAPEQQLAFVGMIQMFQKRKAAAEAAKPKEN